MGLLAAWHSTTKREYLTLYVGLEDPYKKYYNVVKCGVHSSKPLNSSSDKYPVSKAFCQAQCPAEK